MKVGDDAPLTIGFGNGYGRLTLELIVNLWTEGRPAAIHFETEAMQAVDGRHEVLRWKLRAPKPGERIVLTVGTAPPDAPSSVGEIVLFDELDTERSDAGEVVWRKHDWPTAAAARGAGWCLEARSGTGRTHCIEATREGERLSVVLVATVPEKRPPMVEARGFRMYGHAPGDYWRLKLPEPAAQVLELTVHPGR